MLVPNPGLRRHQINGIDVLDNFFKFMEGTPPDLVLMDISLRKQKNTGRMHVLQIVQKQAILVFQQAAILLSPVTEQTRYFIDSGLKFAELADQHGHVHVVNGLVISCQIDAL